MHVILNKICIITPVYNSLDLILDTLQSLLDQRGLQSGQLTYIVCDGGSTDGTLELLQQSAPKFSSKNIYFYIISEKDNGMYDALSKGFYKAGNKYDIYGYINAGDYYSPHALMIVSDVMNSTPAHFLTGLNCWYNEHGHLVRFEQPSLYDGDLLAKGFYGTILHFIQQESTFWDNTIHKELDLNRLKLQKYAGDFYLWNTFIKHTPLYIVSAWLGGFRKHDCQLSSIHLNQYFYEMKKLSTQSTPVDYCKAYFLKYIGYLPYKIRRLFSRYLIEYDEANHKYIIISNK